jgi:hypothetical protein
MSQRQPIVATSTTEAEIIAANEGAKEAIWLSRLFKGIIQFRIVPIIQVDNSAAVRLAQNPEFHRRTKHIFIKHFYQRKSDRGKTWRSPNLYETSSSRHYDKAAAKDTPEDFMCENGTYVK